MEGPISKLPFELIDLIAHYLEPNDFFSLRLVCKAINVKVARPFAETWFTELKTNLTPKSLQRLQEISQAECLRNFPRILAIVNEEDCYGNGNLGRGFPWPRYSEDGRLKDPQQLPAVQILRDALVTSFENCRSFHICGGSTEYEYYDGYHDDNRLCQSDAIEIVLSIVAETGLRIVSLWPDLQEQGIDVNRVDVQLYCQPKFRKAWAGIQELHLEHSFGVDHELFDFMTDLLTHAPHLRSLSLKLKFMIKFKFDLAEEFFGQLVNSVQVPCTLVKFSLASSSIPADLILKLLLPSSRSLRKLSFMGMYLPRRSAPWSDFLSDIKDSFPHLDSIRIERARQHRRNVTMKLGEVVFPALSKILPTQQSYIPGKPANEWNTFHKFPALPLSGDSESVVRRGRFILLHARLGMEQHVLGVTYEGPRMSEALELIVKSIDFVWK